MRPITIFGCFSSAMRRAASPRKAAFRASDSINVTSRSGRSAATTSPGKPAPLPRSVRVFASSGINPLSWAESRTWRRHTSSIVVLPTRLMAFCQRSKVLTSASSRPPVSRETSTPSRCISRRNCSLPAWIWFMGTQDHQSTMRPSFETAASRPPQDEVYLIETTTPHAEERARRASRSMGYQPILRRLAADVFQQSDQRRRRDARDSGRLA